VLPETGVCGVPATRSVAAVTVGDYTAAHDGPLVLLEATVPGGSAAGCCGGPAPAGADACCVKDADAKAAGLDGCGCGATDATSPEPVASAAACCAR
jgi:hypothetical protein